jgi:hypothetical protein
VLSPEHRHLRVRIALEREERVGERGRGRAVDGVAHVGAGEDHGGHGSVALDAHRGGLGHGFLLDDARQSIVSRPGGIMKVDAAINDATTPGETARRLEQLGYDGGFTFEGPHDPFFPLVLASQTTERIEPLHRGRDRVRAQSDAAREHRLGPPGAVARPLPARPRHADPGAHREALFDDVVEARGAHARDGARDPRDLARVGGGQPARLPRRVLPAHADDPGVQPGREPVLAIRRSSSPASDRA